MEKPTAVSITVFGAKVSAWSSALAMLLAKAAALAGDAYSFTDPETVALAVVIAGPVWLRFDRQAKKAAALNPPAPNNEDT